MKGLCFYALLKEPGTEVCVAYPPPSFRKDHSWHVPEGEGSQFWQQISWVSQLTRGPKAAVDQGAPYKGGRSVHR